MEERKGKRTVIILVAVVAAAVIVSAFVHAGEDDFLTDPARIASEWEVVEIWQDEKLISDNQIVILIDIDKNGGFRLWNDDPGDEQRGMLVKADGQLRFDGDNGWVYEIHGRQRQLIVTAWKGEKEETWICKRSGYCRDALRTEEEQQETFFQIGKRALDIEDDTERNLYFIIKLIMDRGCPEGKAITAAREFCIRGRAFVWYAEAHGIIVTDEEVEEYKREFAKIMKETPSAFEGYDAALKKVGMTYEDYAQVEAAAHRWEVYESAVYRKYPEEQENLGEDIVRRFHHTKAYQEWKVELDDAVKKIKEEL